MPHNRKQREQSIRDKYDFVVFDGEYSAAHAALAVVDVIANGGTYTLQFIKDQLGSFGKKVATRMLQAGVNPASEPIYSGTMVFENWERVLGVKIPLPNKFVPYVAARKK